MLTEKSRLAGNLSLALVVFLFLAFTGCAGKKETVKKEDAYAKELNAWTRHVKIYEGLETRVYLTATFKGPDFRRAYVDKYAEGYQLGEDLKKSLVERELEQAEQYNEFFVAAFTPDEAWNDFNRTDSLWRLFMEESSGARLVPVSVTKVSDDPLLREFFPYLDQWSSGYIVKFPKYSETGTEPIPNKKTEFVKLKVTGVLGKGEVEWRLKK